MSISRLLEVACTAAALLLLRGPSATAIRRSRHDGGQDLAEQDLVERCRFGQYYVFKKYFPSRWEQEWLRNRVDWQDIICRTMLQPEHASRSKQWIDDVARFFPENVHDPPHYESLRGMKDDVWSTFVYEDICARMTNHSVPKEVEVLIEPLAGIMRHPFSNESRLSCLPPGVKGADGLEDKSYLMINAMEAPAFQHMYPGRRYLFDMGTSMFTTSLKWMLGMYRRFGISFDRVWGWEVDGIDQQKYWETVDVDVYGKLTLYNIPVSADMSDKGHPFNLLRQVYRPGDFVVVKLDIDHMTLESELLNYIGNNKYLRRMISEFYFEFHFTTPETRNFFGDTGLSYPDALRQLEALRQKGLRLHYWP